MIVFRRLVKNDLDLVTGYRWKPSHFLIGQKQSPGGVHREMFLKVVQNSLKTPVLNLCFNKVADLQPAALVKRHSDTGVAL